MARIFRDNGIRAEGKILPFDDFVLYGDIKNREIPEEKKQRIIELAEAELQKDIPFLPLSLYREYAINGNRSNYENRYFARRSMLLPLAMAEYIEGKGRFRDKLCDVVWAILDETSWIIPAHTTHSPNMPGTDVPEVYKPEDMHGIDLFSATTAAALTAVYYYAKDALDAVSPIIAERLRYEIYNRTIRPYLTCNFWWSGAYGNRVNNWCPWITCNVLYVAALLEDNGYKRTRVVQKALDSLDNFFACYNDDGGCDEGPAYWSLAGGALFDSLELIEDLSGGAINVYSHPLVKAIGEYEATVNIHGDRFVNFADCNSRVSPDGELLIRFGEKCSSDTLIAFGKICAHGKRASLNSSLAYRSIKSLYMNTVTDAPLPKAKKLTYLSGLKIAISRDYCDTGRGMFLAFKGGHNNESHNHNDVGSFIIYHDGKPVIIDAGVGQYTKQTFSSRRYELWYMQSQYHNLPTFGGVGQMPGQRFASKNEVYDESTGALTLDLTDAYPTEACIVSYIRSACLKDGVVTLSEDITLSEEKEISFRMLTHVEPKENEDGSLSLAEGRTLRFPDSLTATVERFVAEGLDAMRYFGTPDLWRISLTVRADSFKGKITVE